MLQALIGLRAITRLRGIIRSWWGIDLMFVDVDGNVVGYASGERFAAPTPLCAPVLESKRGFLRCVTALKQGYLKAMELALQPGEGSTRFYEGSCHAGLHHLALPILLKEQPIGFILCDGIAREKPEEIPSRQIETLEKDLELEPGTLSRHLNGLRRTAPSELDRLKELLTMIFEEAVNYLNEIQQRDERIVALARKLEGDTGFHDLVGRSPAMLKVYDLIQKILETDVTVLIQGENGTGKELVARALHFQGPRKAGPFIAQNCAALNENLLESELFGHARGAFTGAVHEKRGLLETANGGTFFLDEIGEMSLALQAKLLRFLQDGILTPVGSTAQRKVSVRVITASNRDLPALIHQGRFREDLFYRINVIAVTLPPLRERTEDIPLLIEHFLSKRTEKQKAKMLSPETLRLLMNYSWPGNVRELENEIERLVVLAKDEDVIRHELLSPKIMESETSADVRGWGSLQKAIQGLARLPWHRAKERWMSLFSRPYLEEILRTTEQNVSQGAKMVGLPRSTFYRLLHRHGLMHKPH